MKKLFAMILLLFVSLPVLADEVELVCKMKDGSKIHFSFHTEPGYYEEMNKKCKAKGDKSCNKIFVDDTLVQAFSYDSEGKTLWEQLERDDGTYRGRGEGDGKCVKFTRAF